MRCAVGFCDEGKMGLIPNREENAGPIELDRSKHTLCALKSAVSLIAGSQVSVPRAGYHRTAPTRWGRLAQVGKGALGILASAGRRSTLISGRNIAYRGGEIEYFADDKLNHWRSYKKVTQPFFVVPGGTPANAIAQMTGCDPRPAPRLFISKRHCNVVVIANWDGAPAIVHYGACEDAIAEIDRMARGQDIAASYPEIRHLLAKILAHRDLAGGAVVVAQSRISADPSRFSWRKIDAITELWLARKPLSRAGGSVPVPMHDRLNRVCEFFGAYKDMLLPARDVLEDWYETVRLPGELAHGDFWLGNVLFKGNSVAGIIDWEWAREDGIRLVDILHMLIFSPAMEHDTSFPLALRRLWANDIDDVELSGRLDRIFDHYAMSRDDVKFLGLVLWFDILWQRAVRGSVFSGEWLDDMIPQSVPVIRRWLDRRWTKTPA